MPVALFEQSGPGRFRDNFPLMMTESSWIAGDREATAGLSKLSWGDRQAVGEDAAG